MWHYLVVAGNCFNLFRTFYVLRSPTSIATYCHLKMSNKTEAILVENWSRVITFIGHLLFDFIYRAGS